MTGLCWHGKDLNPLRWLGFPPTGEVATHTLLSCAMNVHVHLPSGDGCSIEVSPGTPISTVGGCLDVLDVPQLFLHPAAVSAEFWITPGHNSPRFKNGSKSAGSCFDVLDVPQLFLHLAAVAAILRITPGHNSPRFKNGSKSTVGGCLDVLDVPQLSMPKGASL